MTQRDWQKDMDDVQGYLRNMHLVHHNEQTLRGKPVAEVLQYWLQEAKERKEKELRMKELLETIANAPVVDSAEQEIERHKRAAKSLLATLYPDTPAPKEGDNR